jgi:hypothetical protein
VRNHAAIDDVFRGGDERGLIGRQEHYQPGYFHGIGHTRERDL